MIYKLNHLKATETKIFSDFIPEKNPTNKDKSLAREISNYLESGHNFNCEEFKFEQVYPGGRSNNGVIEGLNKEDAYLLLYRK